MIKSSSLGLKLILAILFLGILSLAHTVFLYRSLIAGAEHQYVEDMTALVEYLKVPVEDFVVTGNETNLKRLVLPTIESGKISGVVIESAEGDRLFSYPIKLDYAAPTKEVSLAASTPDVSLEVIPGVTSGFAGRDMGRMVIFLNDARLEDTIARLWKRLIAICLITVLVIFSVIWMIRKYFISPLNQVFRDAELILAADYGAVRPLDRTDELGVLSRYQKRIAETFNEHDRAQKARMQDILRSNADALALHKDKSLMVDRLLAGLTPALQEAMHTIQFLHDKPSLQTMLSKSILYALSLAEETYTFAVADSKGFAFSPEEIRFSEFVDLVNDYIAFFSDRHRVDVEVTVESAKALINKAVIVDKKELMRFVSYVLEMTDERRGSKKTTLKAFVVLEAVGEDRLTFEIIVRDSESSYDDATCNAINSLMAGADVDRSERFLKSAFQSEGSLLVTPFTLLGLKKLNESTGSSYSIVKSSGRKVMHAFSMPLVIKDPLQNGDGGQGVRTRRAIGGSTIVIVGPAEFLRSLSLQYFDLLGTLKFETYESAAALFPQAQTHYIVDLIGDRKQGMTISRRLVSAKEDGSNIAAVLAAGVSGEFAVWCDVDFDLFFYDGVSPENLEAISSQENKSRRENVVKSIMESLKSNDNSQ